MANQTFLHEYMKCVNIRLLQEETSPRPAYVTRKHALVSCNYAVWLFRVISHFRTDWFQALCGKWDDWCLPDTKKPGLSCCSGYTCKCNLWNTNCRCKAKLFNGQQRPEVGAGQGRCANNPQVSYVRSRRQRDVWVSDITDDAFLGDKFWRCCNLDCFRHFRYHHC